MQQQHEELVRIEMPTSAKQQSIDSIFLFDPPPPPRPRLLLRSGSNSSGAGTAVTTTISSSNNDDGQRQDADGDGIVVTCLDNFDVYVDAFRAPAAAATSDSNHNTINQHRIAPTNALSESSRMIISHRFSLMYSSWRALARQLGSMVPNMPTLESTQVLLAILFDELTAWGAGDTPALTTKRIREAFSHLHLVQHSRSLNTQCHHHDNNIIGEASSSSTTMTARAMPIEGDDDGHDRAVERVVGSYRHMAAALVAEAETVPLVATRRWRRKAHTSFPLKMLASIRRHGNRRHIIEILERVLEETHVQQIIVPNAIKLRLCSTASVVPVPPMNAIETISSDDRRGGTAAVSDSLERPIIAIISELKEKHARFQGVTLLDFEVDLLEDTFFSTCSTNFLAQAFKRKAVVRIYFELRSRNNSYNTSLFKRLNSSVPIRILKETPIFETREFFFLMCILISTLLSIKFVGCCLCVFSCSSG